MTCGKKNKGEDNAFGELFERMYLGTFIALMVLFFLWLCQQIQKENNIANSCKEIYRNVTVNCSEMNKNDRCYSAICSNPNGLWLQTVALAAVAGITIYLAIPHAVK